MLFTGLGRIASNGYKRNRKEDSIITLLVREDIQPGDPPFYDNIMKKPRYLLEARSKSKNKTTQLAKRGKSGPPAKLLKTKG